jgi:ubiquinone/menaquinone biosynthesis C-methylase UbiE
MPETSRHDAWQAGDNYDLYMGRWSRQIAPAFLDLLPVEKGLDWLEVGCGTGALTAAILARWDPADLVCIDPSEGFLQRARENVPDSRARFQAGDAQAIAIPSDSRDVTVSALVINFVPDRQKALAEMKRATRPGGTVGFYVWDYPGGGLGFLRAFWKAATALDPNARDLTEDRRFPFCTPEALVELAESAGLSSVACTPIEAPAVFRDFDDFWLPFTLGAGPAPGYCVSLEPEARQRLEDKLRADLPIREDGSMHLTTRAWAITATS